MSRGEAMKALPIVRMGKHNWSGDPHEVGIGTFSLLPGSDWYDFGGVAIQADPCGECLGGGTATRFRSASDFAASFAGEIIGEEVPCSKCHGLGVIPQHGSIQRLPVHWSKTNEDGSFSGGFAEKRCVVVPIEGDE